MSDPCKVNATEIIVIGIAAITAGLIFWSAIISRKTLKHQRLSILRKEYRDKEMDYALTVISDFKGISDENTVERYEKAPVGDKDTCRRKVSHFFKELADLYADHVLRPKKFLFNIWPEPDLRIIKEVIIPIDDSIRAKKGRGKLPKDNNLWKLYIDAEAWTNKKNRKKRSAE